MVPASDFIPEVPWLFVSLSQRFGLILAAGFAIMTFAPLDKLGRGKKWLATTLLVVLFGLFTILGTYTGNLVFQSYANLRAMGAITAGLLGGPVVGLGVGLMAGLHRYLIDVGGFSALPCGLATVLEGLAAGLVARWLPVRRLDWSVALILGLLGESVHMGLVLALAKPYEEALALVQVIGLPMIVINAAGAAMFVHVLSLRLRLQDLYDSTQARRILAIANQTVAHLRRGFNQDSAQATARIIKSMAPVAAVAITTDSTILAHVGQGEDHHLTGQAVRTSATRHAISAGETTIARDREAIGCSEPDCPLASAVVVPLRKGTRILGSLKLYGTEQHPLDHTVYELAKGLADLFSTQLELEDIGIKNQLLAQAEIRGLQAQINPHFLFNSLNTIASFCRTDPAQARELILDLSLYMRRNLDSSRGLISLAEEMEQVRSYLAIEQARFGARIRVEIDIAPGCETWPIPPLIIQPLVENGVKHGLLGREEPGLVRIIATCSDELLHITIQDDGVGMDQHTLAQAMDAEHSPQPDARHGGIGLRNCAQRLVQLYGPDHGLRLQSAPSQGTRIDFTIPKPPPA